MTITPTRLNSNNWMRPDEAFVSSGDPVFDFQELEYMRQSCSDPIAKGDILGPERDLYEHYAGRIRWPLALRPTASALAIRSRKSATLRAPMSLASASSPSTARSANSGRSSPSPSGS